MAICFIDNCCPLRFCRKVRSARSITSGGKKSVYFLNSGYTFPKISKLKKSLTRKISTSESKFSTGFSTIFSALLLTISFAITLCFSLWLSLLLSITVDFCSDFSLTVQDCIALLTTLDCVRVEYVRQSANCAAHCLVTEAHSYASRFVWGFSPPTSIEAALAEDLVEWKLNMFISKKKKD